jgi:hypothetical protein
MFNTLIENLRFKSENPSEAASKRRYERRETDRCVGVIDGKTFPVENWSPGGLLIFGDSKMFGMGDEINVTIKFRLRDSVMDVPHRAKVVRKAADRIAFQFLPLTHQIKRGFQSVIDDTMAAQFVESQMG